MSSTLIAGDSQVKYISDYISQKYITCKSVSGVRVQNILEHVSPLLANASTIVLHVGANNIRSRTDNSPQAITKLYNGLLDQILDINPHARIVVSGVLPRHASTFSDAPVININETNNVAAATNILLRKMCYRRGMEFVSMWVTFLERQYISRDGLHISPKGLIYMASVFQKDYQTLFHDAPLLSKFTTRFIYIKHGLICIQCHWCCEL